MSAIKLRMAALGKAYELQELLGRVIECPEYGEGSCPAMAAELLEDAIGYLKPTTAGLDEDDDPGAPRLRSVHGTEARA